MKTRVVTEFMFVPTVFSRAGMVVMTMKRGEEKPLTFYVNPENMCAVFT